MSRSAHHAPTAGARLLVIRGPQSALRLALPAFGSLTLGRSPACDIHVPEPGLPEQAAEVFLDFEVGVKLLSGTGERVPFDPAGRGRPDPIAAGKTVDLQPNDKLRIGPVELTFVPAIREVGQHHVWSRAYLEARLQALLWAEADVSVVRVQARGPALEALQGALRESVGVGELVGELGPDERAVLVPGSEARARTLAKEITRALLDQGAELRVGVVRGNPDCDAAQVLEQARLQMAAAAGTSEVCAPQDPSMEPVMRLVAQVARTSAPVLILGETGTGKDVLAQLIHEQSDRATAPLVRVNCVDLPETFLEEADSNFLARAAGGTVLLDQVGGLSSRAQLSLGYLLEESREREHDVRFIATSNQDLARAVEAGTFRKDLYFRLNRVTLAVPPLRARRRDIAPLAEHFIAEVVRSAGRGAVPKLSRAAAAQLEAYGWPGNLRELRNVIERAVLTAPGDVLGVEQLPAEISGDVPLPEPSLADTNPGVPVPSPAGGKPANLRDEMAALEKRRILEALEAYPTQTEAAKALGIPLRTFLNRLDALGIARARKPAGG
jgi:DNA-binding NtrC family response regulator